MPFTWIQNGVKISAHPINLELARAKAIRKIYEWAIEEIVDPHWYRVGGIDVDDL